MLIRQGTYRGLWWKITQSDTVGFWNRVLSVGDSHGCGHSACLDRFRLDGNPRYVEDEIDRLISNGNLPNLIPWTQGR
jgi:hypothetical protein